MKISIICVGRLKEAFFRDASAEYLKRLGRFANVSVIELKDEKIPASPSLADEKKVMKTEGGRILEKLPQTAYPIALCLDGNKLTSEAFSRKLSDLMNSGFPDIAFIIGGSLGLDGEVLNACKYSVCLSNMTFTHQLARIILLEQLYRGFKIMGNEPYHK